MIRLAECLALRTEDAREGDFIVTNGSEVFSASGAAAPRPSTSEGPTPEVTQRAARRHEHAGRRQSSFPQALLAAGPQAMRATRHATVAGTRAC